jgi:ParB-like chromosome segregation protein Spo0J
MIEFIDIDKLSLLENNPRRITKDQFEKLKKSLKEDPKLFELRPCLVNKVGDVLTVYAGNQRVRAASKLKWKQVPCIIQEHIPECLMESRAIKDNKTMGEWDFDVLNEFFDIDTILDAGFTHEEITGDYSNLKEGITESKKENIENDTKQKRENMCPECGHCW